MLAPIVILEDTLVGFIQNSVGPRWHSHLLARVIDIAILIVLEGGLEQQRALFKSLSQRYLAFVLEELVMWSQISELVLISQVDSRLVGLVNPPVHIT